MRKSLWGTYIQVMALRHLPENGSCRPDPVSLAVTRRWDYKRKGSGAEVVLYLLVEGGAAGPDDRTQNNHWWDIRDFHQTEKKAAPSHDGMTCIVVLSQPCGEKASTKTQMRANAGIVIRKADPKFSSGDRAILRIIPRSTLPYS